MAGGRGSVLVVGSANVDFVVRAPRIPAPGETMLGGDLAIAPGGKGANQAVASARAGGAETGMVLVLGNDRFAPIVRSSLADAGVVVHARATDRSTGAALITVSETGENAITVAPGANGDLSVDDLPRDHGASWLLLQLESPIATVGAIATRAKADGAKVMLNAAPARSLPSTLLADTDILVVNEDELSAVAGRSGTIARRIAATGARTAVVTLGSRGACAWADGRYHLQPAFGVDPIDTTAAGDTFCGVLAASLAQGDDITAALRRASAAGALATTRSGAQPGIPAKREVDRLLENGAEGDRDALAVYCGLPSLDAP